MIGDLSSEGSVRRTAFGMAKLGCAMAVDTKVGKVQVEEPFAGAMNGIWVDIDSDKPSAVLGGRNDTCSRTKEGVKYNVVGIGARLDNSIQQSEWFLSRVSDAFFCHGVDDRYVPSVVDGCSFGVGFVHLTVGGPDSVFGISTAIFVWLTYGVDVERPFVCVAEPKYGVVLLRKVAF